jgi:hypothetical protein
MLANVFAVLFNKSDIYFTTESGRVISCRERKPGECCEQKRILSYRCLDSHDQRKEKLCGKLVLIYIFH